MEKNHEAIFRRKNDCKRNVARRLLKQIRQKHPHRMIQTFSGLVDKFSGSD